MSAVPLKCKCGCGRKTRKRSGSEPCCTGVAHKPTGLKGIAKLKHEACKRRDSQRVVEALSSLLPVPPSKPWSVPRRRLRRKTSLASVTLASFASARASASTRSFASSPSSSSSASSSPDPARVNCCIHDQEVQRLKAEISRLKYIIEDSLDWLQSSRSGWEMQNTMRAIMERFRSLQ